MLQTDVKDALGPEAVQFVACLPPCPAPFLMSRVCVRGAQGPGPCRAPLRVVCNGCFCLLRRACKPDSAVQTCSQIAAIQETGRPRRNRPRVGNTRSRISFPKLNTCAANRRKLWTEALETQRKEQPCPPLRSQSPHQTGMSSFLEGVSGPPHTAKLVSGLL
jgi:hypothetical protein